MESLGLQDYKDGGERRLDDRRRDYFDGWVRFLLPIVLAALVAYFTAQGAIREQIVTVKTDEKNHFDEVLRRLDLIQRWMDRQDSKRP